MLFSPRPGLIWNISFPFYAPGRLNDECSYLVFVAAWVQGLAIRLWPGLVKFVAAVAYHFCLNLLLAFTKLGLLVVPCTCKATHQKPSMSMMLSMGCDHQICLRCKCDSWNPTHMPPYLQGSAKRLLPGLVNFVPAVAYHFCLSLPAAFTQPGRSLLADPCT